VNTMPAEQFVGIKEWLQAEAKQLQNCGSSKSDQAQAIELIAELVSPQEAGFPPLTIPRSQVPHFREIIMNATDFRSNKWIVVPQCQQYAIMAQIVTMLNSYR